jgi:hypothetical protein
MTKLPIIASTLFVCLAIITVFLCATAELEPPAITSARANTATQPVGHVAAPADLGWDYVHIRL